MNEEKGTGQFKNGGAGISAISVYIPEGAVDLRSLAVLRNSNGAAKNGKDFIKSLDYTGQKEMRVPEIWEDTVTMVAEAVREVVINSQAKPGEITKLLCGTETAKDNAKPLSSYAQGIVKVGGERIGPACSVFEAKHACAGGTYALLHAVWETVLESSMGIEGKAVVVMGDTSRYDLKTTAELTQGAGAVALLIEKNPKLMRIDHGITGYHSSCVDDFFRAVGSQVAKAKGKFSVQCYMDALVGAFTDFERKARAAGMANGGGLKSLISKYDYFLLHAPFRTMPIEALGHLLRTGIGLPEDKVNTEMERLKLRDSLEATTFTGNLYTASLYLCLADLLEKEASRIGKGIEGKKVLMASYGSGNTMIVFGGTVQEGALEEVRKIRLWEKIDRKRYLAVEEYEKRISFNKFNKEKYEEERKSLEFMIPKGRYFLSGIRDDGYRLYAEKD